LFDLVDAPKALRQGQPEAVKQHLLSLVGGRDAPQVDGPLSAVGHVVRLMWVDSCTEPQAQTTGRYGRLVSGPESGSHFGDETDANMTPDDVGR